MGAMRRPPRVLALVSVIATASACAAPGPTPVTPHLPGDGETGVTVPHGRALGPGATAPDLALEDTTGRTRTLGELHAAGPLVVIFYHGAWCKVCREQLERFQRQLGNASGAISVVGISADPRLTAGKMADGLKLEFLILADPQLRAANAFGVADRVAGLALPAMFVVDKAGTIRWVHIGEDSFVEDQALEAARQAVLEPQPAVK
jgi:peroxiredoxin